MKRNIVCASFFLSIFLLGMTAAALSQDDGKCTMIGRAGDYGFTWTGTMILPSGPVPAAGVGASTFDAAGNMWGTQTTTINGSVSKRMVRGTYTVNPDCTGTLDTSSYDESWNLVNKSTWVGVSVDKMNETRLIMTSMERADGAKIPVAITLNGKKLYPSYNKEKEE